MSLHSSLRVSKAGASQRTVLTRIERIKELMKKGQWSDGRLVTNLPKTKFTRVKAGKKKAKEAAAPGSAAAVGAPVPAAAPGTAKPAAGAKPAAAPAKK